MVRLPVEVESTLIGAVGLLMSSTTKPTMLATDAFNVFTIAVPKLASVGNKLVDVAFVVIEFDEDAAPNEIEPAVKLPLTLRLPEREVSPDTESEFADTEPPESDAPVIEPPVMEGLVIAVPKS